LVWSIIMNSVVDVMSQYQ